jgi:hypothetical protein
MPMNTASALGDNVMEMKAQDPNIDHSEAVLETRPTQKVNSSRVGWGQLSSQDSHPLTLCYAGKLVSGFAPRSAPSRHFTARYAGEELVLCDENVEKVLEGAREDMAAVFGYTTDSRKVGITGTVELVEIEGPIVIIRLGGRFWHKRSDVVQRLANYLQERIPEICDVEVESADQLDDADKLQEKAGGW